MTDNTRLKIFEFLATPAHVWLWLVAKVCGWDFNYGFYYDDEDDDDDRPLGV